MQLFNTPPYRTNMDNLDETELDNEDYEDDDELLEVDEYDLEALMGSGSEEEEDNDSDEADAQSENEDSNQEVIDESILTFDRHTGPVFSCDLHPQRNIAVSGGEDDKVFLWNRESGEVLYEFNKHNDTVTDVAFNYDGTYLATGDMDGEVFVNRLQDSSSSNLLQEIVHFSIDDMSWLRWHFAANVLLAGSESGDIYIWRIPSGDCKILPGIGVRCEYGELANDGKKLFASYVNGNVKLWDLKNCTVIMEVTENHACSHKPGVIAIACDKTSSLFMSGGECGKVLFSTATGPIETFPVNGAIECIAISPNTDIKIAALGTLNGEISIWDITHRTIRVKCEHSEEEKDGITKMKWIQPYTLIVGTIRGNIFAYDGRTGKRIFTLSGHKADIYSFVYCKRENCLLSTSEDKTAKIFKLPDVME